MIYPELLSGLTPWLAHATVSLLPVKVTTAHLAAVPEVWGDVNKPATFWVSYDGVCHLGLCLL